MKTIYSCVSHSVFNDDAFILLDHVAPMKPRLIFMDPPFNIGQDYEDFNDAMTDTQYKEFLSQLIAMATLTVSANGSIWLNLPDHWAADAIQFARLCGLHLENWCIWHYRFAVCQPHRFLRAKTHALWFSRGQPLVNADAARVPSDRAMIYEDVRVDETENGGTRMDFDVWGFDQYWGRIQGNNKERGITPNQLPEKYLERVVGVCTNPGDLVVDPFCGSGTTATVAVTMGRVAITGDTSVSYCRAAADRISRGAIRCHR
jgi:DNA modification methylase